MQALLSIYCGFHIVILPYFVRLCSPGGITGIFGVYSNGRMGIRWRSLSNVLSITKKEVVMAEDFKERMIRYLSDAYAVEEGGLSSLKDIAAEAHVEDVRTVVSDHISVTQSQMDRLSGRIAALGGDQPGGKGLIDKMIGKGSDMLNIFHDKSDKLTQDVIKAYSLEHFEIGMYTSLKAFADIVGDYETSQLADSIMSEEQLAAERLQRLIPQVAKTAISQTSEVTGS